MSNPWSNQLVSLVIVSAPSGAFAGIFVYSPAPGAGNLIGSWAAEAGTDQFGNAYPQGLNVKVGSISGVTFSGTNFIMNSSGLFFYSGTPALGNLILALAPTAGTDAFGNAFPMGLLSNQLTLANQSVAPASFANASIFYSSTAGRPRYKSSAGADNVLPRSDINVATFTVGNTTTNTQISAQLNYQAGEGNQGSEYEIEIDGTITTGTVSATGLNFQMADGGVVIGPHITVGAIFLSINNTFFYSLKARLYLINPGGLVAGITFDGSFSKSANIGSESAFPVNNANANNNSNNVTFDPTIAHTLTIVASWTATDTGQQLVTQRTRITRRF